MLRNQLLRLGAGAKCCEVRPNIMKRDDILPDMKLICINVNPLLIL